jgi:2-polyprenyl-3-methyl-5-hydroxy-6-metoxy-1,4-benzoquinol methylase
MIGKNSNNHEQFYNQAELYDIAFDFKDIKAECDFLNFLAPNAKSFLELGAGTALHCIEMAKRGIASTALDLSNSMVEYGLSKAQKNEVEIEYICSNMIDFKSENKWDLVATLMDSVSYIYTNDDFLTHLKTVANHLNHNGLYVLEMIHPRDVFGLGKSTNTNWEIERDGKKVKVNWGNPHDVFDPITQIVNTSVRLESGDTLIEDIAPQRKFTFNELDVLVKASGYFEMIAVYGAMDKNIPFNNDKAAWRMVPVLRKIK